MDTLLRKLRLALITIAILCLSGFVSAASQASPWYSQSVESKDGFFVVTLESTDEGFALNEYRQWQLVLRDKTSGEGVSPARFVVSGGMPMHGHGLPSQPQVTKHLGHGRYLIEGVRFNMLGKWLFEFEVVTESASDLVSFEVVVDY